MNRVATDTAAANMPARPVWTSFWFAFVLFSLIVSGIGAAVYVSAKRTVMRTVHENLESIARIKVGQVERWLDRSINVAWSGAVLEDEIDHWLDGGMTAASGKHLLKHLQAIAATGKLRAVHLRSAVDGALLMSTDPHFVDLPQDREMALRAIATRKPVIDDFHRVNLPRPGIEVDFHVPLGMAGESPARAVAQFQLDPAVSLLPFLDQWPGASASAETLLFRIDGDEIVFLNHSRHDAVASLAMRRPLADEALLAAQAARGRVGALSGVDYRGIASLGFALPVDGTAWYLIAKVDESEALADLDRMALLATAALLLLMLAFAGWKAEHSRHVEAEYRVLFERALLAKRLEFLARYANDGILLADTAGRIIEVNELCAQLYGYRREEVLGIDLAGLWPGGGPEDAIRSDDAVYEAEHCRKDGSPIAVEISSRMIDIDGARYFQALVRDVTVRRRAEEALRGSEERASRYAEQLEDLYQNAPCGYHSVDADGFICRMNNTELRWLGYARAEVVGRMKLTDLLDVASRVRFEQRFPIFKREGQELDLEMVFMRKDGSKLSALLSATAIYDDTGNFLASRTTVTDVSYLQYMQRERDRQARRVEALSRHLVAVQEEERRRLSCELNDRASPNLAAIKLSLDTLSRSRPAGAEDCIADACALIDDTIAGVREVCADLRPSMLDYGGVMPALVGYTQQYTRRTGIAVRLVRPRDDLRLGAEVESTLFRIVQEALTNVVRHAVAATVDIALASDEHSTSLTVRDDGVGFDSGLLPAASAPGLRAMRERAEFAGGSFRIVSDPGKGTEIHVELPTPRDVSDSPRHRLTISDATATLQ